MASTSIQDQALKRVVPPWIATLVAVLFFVGVGWLVWKFVLPHEALKPVPVVVEERPAWGGGFGRQRGPRPQAPQAGTVNRAVRTVDPVRVTNNGNVWMNHGGARVGVFTDGTVTLDFQALADTWVNAEQQKILLIQGRAAIANFVDEVKLTPEQVAKLRAIPRGVDLPEAIKGEFRDLAAGYRKADPAARGPIAEKVTVAVDRVAAAHMEETKAITLKRVELIRQVLSAGQLQRALAYSSTPPAPPANNAAPKPATRPTAAAM